MKLRNLFIFIAIILVSFLLRVYGVNWDQGTHLHPDERFLTMVISSMKMPESWLVYFNPATSLFNPFNTGHTFFVYGVFPLVLAKLASIRAGMDTYEGIVIIGRILSALADTSIIISLFFFIKLFEKRFHISRWLKYISAAAYGSTVFAIQQAHFFTVDSFTTAFYFLSLVFLALWFEIKLQWMSLVLSALFFGFALASKVSALYGLPPLGLFFLLRLLSEKEVHGKLKIIGYGTVWMIISYLFLRLANPYYFATSSFYDVSIHPLFASSISQLKQLSTADAWFPPAVQWITKTPILFPLQNIVLWGLGLAHSALAIIGLFFFGKTVASNKNNIRELVLLAGLMIWSLILFLYQGTRFGMTMRYFYILYPFFAIMIGYGLMKLSKLSQWLFIVSVVALSLWPLSFMHIYSQDHSRVQASKWMYQHIKPGSVIGTEHWDDALPLGLPSYTNTYQYKELPVFAPDNDDKWKIMNDNLQIIDYYVLSSNRAYGSILSDSKDYPKMAPFYDKLLAGTSQFEKVAEFTSYPTLCIPLTNRCLIVNDDMSEEAFTVYDHPKVLIYQKKPL